MKKFTKEQERIYDRVRYTIVSKISEYSNNEFPLFTEDIILNTAFDICDIFNDTSESKFGFKSDLKLRMLEDLSNFYVDDKLKTFFKNELLSLKINLGV
jgi:hypothetical protein